MKTGGGDFTPEAYDQLREAYAKEATDTKSIEQRGHDIMGLNLGLETAPVDSPWADLIPNAEYPSGKSEYLDGKQDPAEILELMRNSVAKPEEEVEEEEEVEVEEEVLSDEDEVEEEDEDNDEDDEDDEDDDDDTEDDDDDDDTEDDDEEDEEAEDEIEPVDDADVDAIAAQIAELRAEIEQMSFVPETETEDDES